MIFNIYYIPKVLKFTNNLNFNVLKSIQCFFYHWFNWLKLIQCSAYHSYRDRSITEVLERENKVNGTETIFKDTMDKNFPES